MPFELRNPSGLWLLGLLLPLVVFYILRIRRQRLVVPSTWLWAAASRDLLAKSPFKRLVVQVPLVLQALALALLALALSKPASRAGAIGGDHLAIVIDTSASMSARGPDGKTRIEEARAAAKRVVAGLAPGAEALIVDAGREPRIASPPDRDRRRLEAAIDRIEARDVEGQLGRAIALAVDRLKQVAGADRTTRRVVVVTDGAVADRDAIGTTTLPVDVIEVGTPVDNAAVVRVDVRSGIDPATHREQVQVFAMLVNYGGTPRDAFVTLRLRNAIEPLASRRVTLSPREHAPVVLTFEPERGDAGAGLVVEISPNDALTADDRAFGRVPPGRKLPVVLAPADSNPWFKRALASDPDVELLGTSLGSLASAGVPDDALVVIDGACPASLPGADFLVSNPPAGRCRTATSAELLEQPSITSWNEADPRLRFLTLDGVEVLRARRIEAEGPGDVLVRARQGVLISDVSMPGRTGTLIGFDVGESNWPLKASFVLFVRNVVELARAHRAHDVTGPSRTGEPLRLRVPPEVDEAAIEAPDGKQAKIVARSGLAIVPEAPKAGFYHVSWQGAHAGSVLAVANLTSEAESDLSPHKVELAHVSVRKTASALEDALTDFSWVFGLVAFALMVADVIWLTRRPKLRSPLGAGRPPLPERRRAGTAPAAS